jgi:WD40 repeat protein
MDRTARVWDALTGERLLTLTGHSDGVWSVAFSPDGTRLLTSARAADGTARIWEATSGQELLVLRGHTGTIVQATFSPDGRRVATASRDGTARVWDAATGQEQLRLYGDNEGLSGVAFSPDGTRLAAGGDSVVRLYVLPIEDLIGLARTRLTRSWTADECQQFLHQEQCPD